MTVQLWSRDVVPSGDDVETAMLCHWNVQLGRSTWEEFQDDVGEVASWLQTIADLCLKGF